MMMEKQAVNAETILKVRNRAICLFETDADYNTSVSVADRNRATLLFYSQALAYIVQNPELKKRLLGKVFYIADNGPLSNGYYCMKNGTLAPGRGDPERTVQVCAGNNYYGKASMFEVSGLAKPESRFMAYGQVKQSIVAPIIVCLRQDAAQEKNMEMRAGLKGRARS